MTWEILVGLIAIVGCLISLGTVLAKLVITLTKLTSTCDELNKTLTQYESQNDKDHTYFRDTIQNHEIRIHDVERNEHA